MDSTLKLNTGMRHGYLLTGKRDDASRVALGAAATLLECELAKLNSHPDFSHWEIESFGIKDSQELKSKSFVTPVAGKKKVFIVEFFSLTTEAANALLKLFEEPPLSTHFFIIVPSADIVIPTLRSRLITVNYIDSEPSAREFKDDPGEFLKELPNTRLKMVKKIDKDKKRALELVNGIELLLAKQLGQLGQKHAEVSNIQIRAFEDIQKSRELLLGRSPLVKMILEHLALVLPTM